MSPTVSVVVPVLDDEAALRVCLQHLARQTCLPAEVVVVDNSPAGDLGGAVTALLPDGVVRIVHERRPGVAAAASSGYDAALGDVIARCDADCRPGATWVEDVAAAFAADPDLDACTGDAVFYDLPSRAGRLATVGYQAGLRWGMGMAMASIPLWGSNMAMRRSAWERVSAAVHRDDPRLHDDLDLSFQLGPLARVRHLPHLPMQAEARIFHSRQALTSRVERAIWTCRVNWHVQSSGRRWVHRVSGGRSFAEPGLPWI